MRLDEAKSADFRDSARLAGRFDRLRRMRHTIFRCPGRPTARSCPTTTRNWGNVGLYVRSGYGHSAAWYRGTQRRREGRIKAGGIKRDVAFADVDPTLNDQIDIVYRAKYRRHGARWFNPMVAPEARSTTIRLMPR